MAIKVSANVVKCVHRWLIAPEVPMARLVSLYEENAAKVASMEGYDPVTKSAPVKKVPGFVIKPSNRGILVLPVRRRRAT